MVIIIFLICVRKFQTVVDRLIAADKAIIRTSGKGSPFFMPAYRKILKK